MSFLNISGQCRVSGSVIICNLLFLSYELTTASPVCLATMLQLPSAVLIAMGAVALRLINCLIELKIKQSAPESETISWFLVLC